MKASSTVTNTIKQIIFLTQRAFSFKIVLYINKTKRLTICNTKNINTISLIRKERIIIQNIIT